MNVLVTGGAGFIGSHTVDLLLKEGLKVRILDSLTPPVHLNGKKPLYLPEDVQFILGKVTERNVMAKALKGVDVVFHLAAYQDYLPDFSKFFRVNTVSTSLIYEIIVTNKLPIKKVIIASSQAVYGEGKYRCSSCSKDPGPESGSSSFPQFQSTNRGPQYPPPRSLKQLERKDWNIKCPACGSEMSPLLTDEAVVNPHNQYAMSKYTQEIIALNLGRRYNIPTVCLRYSITQGSRQSFFNAYSGVLRSFVVRLLNNERPVIYEDGEQLRDYVWVGDVARANLLVLEDNRADFEVFNVGGGKKNTITVLEYANLLTEKLGKTIEPDISGKFRFGDTRHITSDLSKIKNLGWKPSRYIDEIAEEYINWVESQGTVKDYYAEAERIMRKVNVVRLSQ